MTLERRWPLLGHGRADDARETAWGAGRGTGGRSRIVQEQRRSRQPLEGTFNISDRGPRRAAPHALSSSRRRYGDVACVSRTVVRPPSIFLGLIPIRALR